MIYVLSADFSLSKLVISENKFYAILVGHNVLSAYDNYFIG